DVFRPLAERNDLGRVQRDLVPAQYPRQTIKQTGPISRDDGEIVILAFVVGPDVDFRRDGEVLQLPRYASARRRAERCAPLQPFAQFVFDQVDDVAIVVRRVHPQHDEAVERVPVAGIVDLGVHDVEVDGLEVAADAREQIRVCRPVDEHLQPFAEGRQARLHHRPFGAYAPVQAARLPGDFLRLVAHEVGGVQFAPEAFAVFVGQGVQTQQAQRFGLTYVRVLTDGYVPAGEQPLRGME